MRRLFRFIALTASLAAFSAYAQERQVYSLPQGAHPHDVAPAPDGDVWYAIVRFDPTTEAIKVWALPQDVGYASSIPPPSTATASSGLPGRAEFTEGSTVYFVSLAGSYLASIVTTCRQRGF